jgi:hypothetical protein
MLVTLASATERVVQLEALMQARYAQEFDAAVEGLSTEQTVVVLALEFVLRDRPGGSVMSQAQCAAWLRAGMPASGLPRHVRPFLSRAQDLACRAQRVLATVGAGAPQEIDDGDVVAWCCWLADRSPVE